MQQPSIQQKIHWKPQAKQEIALARIEDEILFGGSRGGGKTDAGQAWLLYDKDNPKYRALVIRRNATDLEDWIDRAKAMFAPAGGVFVGNTFNFPSGARIRTGHLKDDNAYSKYQGHEYQKILMEELTHIPNEADYEKLRASCRSTVVGIKPQIFATTNPDGPGRKWVKKRWNIPDRPTDIVISSDERTGLSRIFIPSKLQDNQVLMENDPGYIKQLESITDDELREAWLEGSWAGFGIKGSYYKTQIQQAHKEGRIKNVPYEAMLPVYTWWDLGVGDSTAIGFFQVLGNEWRVIDYYEASGEGLAHYIGVLREKGYVYEDHYAPHDIEVREFSSGKSRLEMAKELGIHFKIAPKLSIDDGINAARSRFNTVYFDAVKCERLLEALANYQKEWNDKLGDFKNAPLHDWSSHAADMWRYWAVTQIRRPDTEFQNRILRNRMNSGTMK